jgi:MFS family permease
MTAAQGFTQLALPWLVLDLTGSLGQMGIVISLQGVAWTIIALVGGMLADRYSRRMLLISTQTVTILNLSVLALLTVFELIQIWHIYISALILGVNQGLTMPARSAIMRSLVGPEDMMNAVALNAMQQHAMRILWPSLAGIIIGALGVGAALLTGAGGAALAVLLLLTLRHIQEPERGAPTTPLYEMKEGIRYSFASPVLRMLMLINFAVAFFGLAFLNMAPGFSREVLGFNATTTGFFVMASGVGSITASVGLVFYEVRDKNRFVVLALAGFGAALLLLCLNPLAPGAFVLMIFFGLANSSLAVTAQAIMQTEAEQRYLGRVVALWSMGGGIGALTAFPIGAAGDEFGLRYSLGFVAAVLVLCAVYIGLAYLPAAQDADRRSRRGSSLETAGAAGD